MNSNIIYETNNTIITHSTIKRGNSVYQISQINDIFIDDDRFYVDYKYKEAKSNKRKTIIRSIIAIIIGILIMYYSIIFSLIIIIISGIVIYFTITEEIKKSDISYTLNISFVNGVVLKITGGKNVIYEMKDAIVYAMEN